MPGENKKHLYAPQLQKLGRTSLQNGAKPRRAIFILASSEGDAVAIEKNDCIHTDISKPPHPMVLFSLIRGLAGAAARPNTGIITFDRLRKYVKDRMIAEKTLKN